MPRGIYDRGERFWTKVDKSGPVHPTLATPCWLWKASTRNFGYGQVSRGPATARRVVAAHRLSWEITNGPVPDGLFVLHHCDNPPCVNPDHLWLGTRGDNNRDRVRKGRSNRRKTYRESHPA